MRKNALFLLQYVKRHPKLVHLRQYPFGVGLLILGLNGFFKFLPLPEKMDFAKVFMQTLHDSGYMMPTIACIQLFSGMALLLNRYKTLGLLLLAPVSFNIFFFHLFHDRAALLPATAILLLNAFFLAKTGFFKQILQGDNQ